LRYLVLAALGVLGTLFAVSLREPGAAPPRQACSAAITRDSLRETLAEVLGRDLLPLARTAAAQEDAQPRPAPPARPAGIELLRGWDTDPDVRRQWLFRAEADLLELCGTPDVVQVSPGGAEVWTYRLRDRRFGLSFHRGRLVDAR
jgi:hypothetical protein